VGLEGERISIETEERFIPGFWTEWLNRDGPGGSGDWELLAEFVAAGQACESPRQVECRTVDGVPWNQTGDDVTCTVEQGAICRNPRSPGGSFCRDYEVRFLCPRVPAFSFFDHLLKEINPLTGQRFTRAQVDRISALHRQYPENTLLGRFLSPPAERAEERRRERELSRRITAGEASRDEIDRYFDRRRRTLEDRLQLLRHVLGESRWDRGVHQRYRAMEAYSQGQLDRLPARRRLSHWIRDPQGPAPFDGAHTETGKIPLAPDGHVLPRALLGDPLPFVLGAVDGFGDYHAHQLSGLAYDGRLYHGSHQGPEATALAPCRGDDHALSWIPDIAGEISGGGMLTEFARHPGRTRGFTGGAGSYRDWPTWQSFSHQQYWQGWLDDARQRGLKLFVMSAVNARILCSLAPESHSRFGGPRACEDMDNLLRQIQAAHRFDQATPWYEIARTPGEARRIILEGKMAVLLSLEASEIFQGADDEQEVEAQLQAVFDLGVRSLQPVHHVNNQFAGAAFFMPLFDFYQRVLAVRRLASPDKKEALAAVDEVLHGFDLDAAGHNTVGLKPLGESLLEKMMDRRMIVDLAHMSDRGFDRAYQLAEARDYYPINVSHAHLLSMFPQEAQDEKKVGEDQIRKIKRTGGVLGLRPGPELVQTYGPSGVENDCQGSSRSFAQSYVLGAVGYDLPMGLASDMNGGIDQMRPRFYDRRSRWSSTPQEELVSRGPVSWACGEDVNFRQRRIEQADQGSRATQGTGTDFDLVGLAHVGHLPNVLHDLNRLGVDTLRLEESAEDFLRMWERIFEVNRGPLDDSIAPGPIVENPADFRCPVPHVKQRGTYEGRALCRNGIDGTIQEHNCSGNGRVRADPWCIVGGGDEWALVRRLVEDLCPVPHVKRDGEYLEGKIVCESRPDPTIQRQSCTGDKRISGDLCIVGGGGYWLRVRRLVDDKCPVPHVKKSGSIEGKIVCESRPDPTIQRHNCTGGKRVSGPWCIVGGGDHWVRVRRLVEDICPGVRDKVGHRNDKILCQNIPSFRIRKSRCVDQGGEPWNGWCLWDEGWWYLVRRLR